MLLSVIALQKHKNTVVNVTVLFSSVKYLYCLYLGCAGPNKQKNLPWRKVYLLKLIIAGSSFWAYFAGLKFHNLAKKYVNRKEISQKFYIRKYWSSFTNSYSQTWHSFVFSIAIVSNDTDQSRITKRNWKQFDMFICNKAELYRVLDTVYLCLQLKEIVNFLKWILGRKSWLTIYNPSNSWFLPPFGSVELSVTASQAVVKAYHPCWLKNYLQVLNFAQLIFEKSSFFAAI